MQKPTFGKSFVHLQTWLSSRQYILAWYDQSFGMENLTKKKTNWKLGWGSLKVLKLFFEWHFSQKTRESLAGTNSPHPSMTSLLGSPSRGQMTPSSPLPGYPGLTCTPHLPYSIYMYRCMWRQKEYGSETLCIIFSLLSSSDAKGHQCYKDYDPRQLVLYSSWKIWSPAYTVLEGLVARLRWRGLVRIYRL